MKWKYETGRQWRDKVEKWHRWFAWHPARFRGDAYWLCYIERRLVNRGLFQDGWEYREIE